MPTDNIYNPSFSIRLNNYNPITNPVSPYRSWIPPSHSYYTSEEPNDYTFCFEFSHFLKKKTKKETLEIE